MSTAPSLTIRTIDTDFSKGRLRLEQEISLADTAKLHGHLCDGLVVGFIGLREALYRLYPSTIIDRTNTRIVSKASPCFGDIAMYLTGGRYQFDSFYVDDAMDYAYIVQRMDTGLTYGVKLKPGIKPSIIDEMGSAAIDKKLSPCELDHLKKLEDDFSEALLCANPVEIFIVETLRNFKWEPDTTMRFIKTDVLNKDAEPCYPSIL